MSFTSIGFVLKDLEAFVILSENRGTSEGDFYHGHTSRCRADHLHKVRIILIRAERQGPRNVRNIVMRGAKKAPGQP